jgi:hypothetical protein
MWLATLSGQLPIEALVSFYLTNKLIGRGLIFEQQPKPLFIGISEELPSVSGISNPFGLLSPSRR